MYIETLKKAGYRYIKAIDDKNHLLQPDQLVDGYHPFMEVWREIESATSEDEYCLIYRGRALTFCRSIIN